MNNIDDTITYRTMLQGQNFLLFSYYYSYLILRISIFTVSSTEACRTPWSRHRFSSAFCAQPSCALRPRGLASKHDQSRRRVLFFSRSTPLFPFIGTTNIRRDNTLSNTLCRRLASRLCELDI